MSIESQIARLVVDQQLCLRCLSVAADLDEDAARLALKSLAATVLVIEETARCRWCGALEKTFTMPTHY